MRGQMPARDFTAAIRGTVVGAAAHGGVRSARVRLAAAVVVALSSAWPASASPDFAFFRPFHTVPGSGGHIIRALLQDRTGILWMLSDLNLFRFEGTELVPMSRLLGPCRRGEAMLEDSLGHIWCAGEERLVRFDPVSLRVLETPPDLPATLVYGLLERRRADIWVASQHGVFRSIGGAAFEPVAGPASTTRVPAYALACDREGRVYIGATAGLLRWENDRVEVLWKLPPKPPGERHQPMLRGVAVDEAGAIWFGCRYPGGLYRMDAAGVRRFGLDDGMPSDEINAIIALPDGSVWFATERGAMSWKDGRFEAFVDDREAASQDVHSLLVDDAGRLWLGTFAGGLVMLRSRAVYGVDHRSGLSHPTVLSAARDRSGNLWVGTQAGLCRRAESGNFEIVDHVARRVSAIAVATDGALWYADQLDLVRRAGATRESVRLPAEIEVIHSIHARPDGGCSVGTNYGRLNVTRTDGGWQVSRVDERAFFDSCVAADGSYWIATQSGVLHLRGDEVVESALTDIGVHCVAALSDGRVAASSGGVLLVRGRDGRWNRAQLGDTNETISGIAEDADGRVWVGCTGGVIRIDGERAYRFNETDGLVSRIVTTLLPIDDDTLFVGTVAGASWVDVRNWRPNLGPPRVGLREAVAGTARFRPGEPIRVEHDHPTIALFLYGVDQRDSAAVRFAHRIEPIDTEWSSPTLEKVIHATRLPRGRYQVWVRAIGSNGVSSAPRAVATIDVAAPWWLRAEAAGTASVLTAALLAAGLGVRRRIRSARAAWAVQRSEFNALKQAEAFYRGIFAGVSDAAYIIDESGRICEVNDVACRMLGYTRDELLNLYVWDVQPYLSREKVESDLRSSLSGDVVLTEGFNRTKDGRRIPVTVNARRLDLPGRPAVLALARDNTMQKRHELLLERMAERYVQTLEAERAAIARELHDALGQALTAIKIDAASIQSAATPNSPMRERADEISRLADQMFANIRTLAHELRPPALDELGLTAAITGYCEHFTRRTGIVCELQTPEIGRALPGEAVTHAFRIVQEALTNVARHSMATRVRVRMDASDTWLEVEVSDNGIGFESRQEPNDGTLGIVGMRERVRSVRGRFEISSRPGEGTRVSAKLPLSDVSAPPVADRDAEFPPPFM